MKKGCLISIAIPIILVSLVIGYMVMFPKKPAIEETNKEVLFLLDIFNLFQTKSGFLKALIYYGVIVLPIPLLILEFKANRNLGESIIKKGIPILAIIGVFYLNLFRIIFNSVTWKTQTLALVNEKMTNHKVEFQIKNSGTFGYAKRNVEVVYLSNYFYVVWNENYDDRNFLNHQWERVNQDINEMGLK